MTYRYALVLLLFVAGRGSSQVTLNAGDVSPVPGQNFLVQTGDWIDPGFGWFGGVQDHTDFVASTSSTISYVTVASTPFAANYSTSTVAEAAGANTWGFMRANSTAFEFMGLRAPNVTLTCSSGMMIVPYPITYEGDNSESYTCSGTSAGESYTRTGDTYVVADGYGTLQLPYGSVANVLRLYHTNTYTDAGPLIDDQGTVTTYYWYKPGVEFPLLAVHDVNTFFVSQQYSRMLDPTSTGVAEALRNSIGLELYPNPATNAVSLVFGANGRLHVDVIDATGRTVLVEDLGMRTPGVHRHELDIQELTPGMYTVRILDEAGGSGTQRLLVQ